ncbi:hypothetical protein SUGI_0926430 [Cryptomeria japonica]|nr:hypothetical protein SUGI_0926430 [Cryptomeria japonica]
MQASTRGILIAKVGWSRVLDDTKGGREMRVNLNESVLCSSIFGLWKTVMLIHQKIKNPNYKGKWKAPLIDNPEFNDDLKIYVYPNLKYIGIES